VAVFRGPAAAALSYHGRVGNTGAQDGDPADLARWLEEVGRRGYKRSADARHDEDRREAPKPRRPRVARPELLLLLGLAASAYLIYYLLDVQLQILLVPAIVVFVAG